MTSAIAAPATLGRMPTARLPHWARPRGLMLQGLLLAFLVWLGWSIIGNAEANMAKRGLTLGFGFLSRSAGIPIGEFAIPYTPADTYARALLVGVLNTLRVAVIGCILCTILGVLLGVARLSPNPLLRALTGGYVEVVRNTPLVLQLVFWHALVLQLPPVRQAVQPLPGVFLSQRGMKIPALIADQALVVLLAGLLVGLVAALLWRRHARAVQMQQGRRLPVLWPALALIVLPPVLLVLATGQHPTVEWPALMGFNFRGGVTMSPEFVTILVGLVVYTSAFVAEIVRAGILSVGKGQWEAAGALGLHRGLTMRLIVLPQALRVIIPPQTSQYLNLTKNSSLAVVIGYPDLVSIANTSINQTGQAIEVITIFMTIYLALSLLTSAAMNAYNRRVALKER